MNTSSDVGLTLLRALGGFFLGGALAGCECALQLDPRCRRPCDIERIGWWPVSDDLRPGRRLWTIIELNVYAPRGFSDVEHLIIRLNRTNNLRARAGELCLLPDTQLDRENRLQSRQVLETYLNAVARVLH
jgi:hypothetical protein